MTRIADLPFRERPVLELLHLDEDRDEPDREYAGFGWARAPRVWLVNEDGTSRPVDNPVIVALHAADDGERLSDDIELEFELADRPVTVLASMFLERWLPRLPRADAIVLAICNPHLARLRPPDATSPIHYAIGEVTSWIELAEEAARPDRILLNAQTWCTLPARRPPCPTSN